MKSNKITLKQVKDWEKRAYDLYDNTYRDSDLYDPEYSKEKAQQEQYDIYSQEIAFDYGNYAICIDDETIDFLKQYYTKGALQLILDDYDPDLTYLNMRKHLQYSYNVDKDDDYFDVNC